MTISIPDAQIERIYPSQNNIAAVGYNGVNAWEQNARLSQQWQRPINAILADLDGGGLPLSTAGFVITQGANPLDVDVSNGRAYISGYYCELLAGSNTLSISDDQDNYIWLELNINQIVQTSPSMRIIVDSVSPGGQTAEQQNRVLIGKVDADTGVIIRITDFRPSQIKIAKSFKISSQLLDGTSAKKTTSNVYCPPTKMYLCGFFTKRSSAGPLLTGSYDYTVKVEGPAGFVSTNRTGSTDDGYIADSIEIPVSLGRFNGGYVKITLTSATTEISTILVYAATVDDPDDDEDSLTRLVFSPGEFDTDETFALKEWAAIG